MIVNDDKKFIFVSIAKCASTSVRRRLGYFEDPPPEIYHMFLEDILKVRPDAENYFKFAFTRNPYDRLYSTYINLKYDGHSWATALKRKPTFHRFVLDLEGSEYSKYIHLQPQSSYVKIGEAIGVNFLGRVENIDEDFEEVEDILDLPHVKLGKTRLSSTRPHEPKFYNEEMKAVVQRVCGEDFERFGYDK